MIHRSLALCASLLSLACRSGGSGEQAASETEIETTRSQAEQACGRVVFVESTGEHGEGRMRVVPASGGAIGPVTTTPEGGELSEFPAQVSPDGRALLVLSSQPDPSGKTRDHFGLLELASLPGVPKAIGPDGPTKPFGPEQAQLRNPSISPDGAWIAFESDAESFRDLYRIDLASGALLRLTNDPQGNFEPSIAPDGQSVAFASSRDGNAEIYVMTADGGDPRRLTKSAGDDTAPLWSPDGRVIAFLSARERTRGIDVFLMQPDGGAQRPALPERAQAVIARDLAFSPDGTQLAFTELMPTKGAKVVIVEVETGAVVTRTEPKTIDEQPAWSPDGKFLLFVRNRGEGDGAGSDIVRMRVDGGELEVLTDGRGAYWLPRWVVDSGCPRGVPTVTAAGVSNQG